MSNLTVIAARGLSFRATRAIVALAPLVGLFLFLSASPARADHDAGGGCKRSGKHCRWDAQCCEGLVCGESQACQSGCRIAGVLYAAGMVNPRNECQECRPSTSTHRWSDVADGKACDDENQCTSGDACLAGGCTGYSKEDGTTCDDGDHCTSTDICLGGACTECTPGGHCSETTATACAFDDDCPVSIPEQTCQSGYCSVDGLRCTSDTDCLPVREACVFSANPRFVDNDDQTVTDRKTCLVWEKKDGDWTGGHPRGYCPGGPDCCPDGVNCADPHNVNLLYSHATCQDLACLRTGSAYTDFLPRLNSTSFAGHGDWRLPTSAGLTPDLSTFPTGESAELESILLASCPGFPLPCIDPIFGPTAPNAYWSSSFIAFADHSGFHAWYVHFGSGDVQHLGVQPGGARVRAVRGGPPHPDGSACDDQNVCTLDDSYTSCECVGSRLLDCDDGNPCTEDSCDSRTGCAHAPLADGAACDDVNGCTGNDACRAVRCVGEPILCDAATTDHCYPPGSCTATVQSGSCAPKAAGATCDDGNACTAADACREATCVGAPILCDSVTTDHCYAPGSCTATATTGTCAPRPDGATCDEGSTAPQVAVCAAGACTQCAPGGHCSATTTMACAFDGDCPLSAHQQSCDRGLCSGGPVDCLSATDCQPVHETCAFSAHPRFVDNGLTVTDLKTCRVWEKKDGTWSGDFNDINAICPGGLNCADPHDVNNRYSLSTGYPYDRDGTAFTNFLPLVNEGIGYAGHTDWRLPTSAGWVPSPENAQPAELESILLAPCPGYGTPCIDPIFGPTALFYWSATSYQPGNLVVVDFGYGGLGASFTSDNWSVRAVRGGP